MSYEKLPQFHDISVVGGDTVDIAVDVGENLTGWTFESYYYRREGSNVNGPLQGAEYSRMSFGMPVTVSDAAAGKLSLMISGESSGDYVGFVSLSPVQGYWVLVGTYSGKRRTLVHGAMLIYPYGIASDVSL